MKVLWHTKPFQSWKGLHSIKYVIHLQLLTLYLVMSWAIIVYIKVLGILMAFLHMACSLTGSSPQSLKRKWSWNVFLTLNANAKVEYQSLYIMYIIFHSLKWVAFWLAEQLLLYEQFFVLYLLYVRMCGLKSAKIIIEYSL